MRVNHVAALLGAALTIVPMSAFAQRDVRVDADAEIRRAIIADSLSRYPGPCPCPYNVARNGSRCGKRSAYSKPGGYSPICYDADITSQMIEQWRKNTRTGLRENLAKPR